MVSLRAKQKANFSSVRAIIRCRERIDWNSRINRAVEPVRLVRASPANLRTSRVNLR